MPNKGNILVQLLYMKGGIPRNIYLVQWSRRIKRKVLYPHPKLLLGLVPYRPFTVVCRKVLFLDYIAYVQFTNLALLTAG